MNNKLSSIPTYENAQEYKKEIMTRRQHPTTLIYFKMYKFLGGGIKDMDKYEKILNNFYKHTFNAYISNECCENGRELDEDGEWLYENRYDAFEGFRRSSKLSCNHAKLIFNSIDYVSAYS